LSLTLSIKRVPLLYHLLLTHLLSWRVLLVEDLDQGKQPIQVPMLAFKWNVQSDHPVVDEF
jgi:hypothetical protein